MTAAFAHASSDRSPSIIGASAVSMRTARTLGLVNGGGDVTCPAHAVTQVDTSTSATSDARAPNDNLTDAPSPLRSRKRRHPGIVCPPGPVARDFNVDEIGFSVRRIPSRARQSGFELRGVLRTLTVHAKPLRDR